MSRPILVSLLGSKEIGKDLAKKGTSSDITLYNRVQGDLAFTYIEPTQFPEKFPPLLVSLAIGRQVILAVDTVGRDLAEAIVTADLAGKTEGLLALAPSVGEEDVRRILKGTRLEKVPAVPLDPKAITSVVEGWASPSADGEAAVPVDHIFPVKGVGTVALGVVKSGTVKVHDRLRLYPSERSVEVRSIQVHDVDVPEASAGSRVGLALKGVEAEEVSRGEVLAPNDTLRVADTVEISGYASCRFFKGKAGEGDHVHLSVGLQVVPAKIQQVDGDRLTLSSDRPLVVLPGDRGFVLQLSGTGTGPRVAGAGIVH
ncbi:MAG: hypothetical protein KGJ23_13010 [Euryarchaeota archaeon]|nr:hypothetical protein [Euryarchaeota archaeon]MDE1837519.1 hypothetical protein [Euryarchaeota archaeon]MDE1880000.1 hypothetical protein [Euryarchaeota archaeon]MDE2046494.1 hypothetical protein [Thermoplasmata archaeon]